MRNFTTLSLISGQLTSDVLRISDVAEFEDASCLLVVGFTSPTDL